MKGEFVALSGRFAVRSDEDKDEKVEKSWCQEGTEFPRKKKKPTRRVTRSWVGNGPIFKGNGKIVSLRGACRERSQ